MPRSSLVCFLRCRPSGCKLPRQLASWILNRCIRMHGYTHTVRVSQRGYRLWFPAKILLVSSFLIRSKAESMIFVKYSLEMIKIYFDVCVTTLGIYLVLLPYSFPISHERFPNIAFWESVSNIPPVRYDPLYMVTMFFWHRTKFRWVCWTPYYMMLFHSRLPTTIATLLGAVTLNFSLISRSAYLHLGLRPLSKTSIDGIRRWFSSAIDFIIDSFSRAPYISNGGIRMSCDEFRTAAGVCRLDLGFRLPAPETSTHVN
jgi:hypothetical protein